MSGCKGIRILFSLHPEELRVTVSGEDCAAERDGRPDPDELAIIRCILESMVDGVELGGQSEELSDIRMVKRIHSNDKAQMTNCK